MKNLSVVDNMAGLAQALAKLTGQEVLVGIPAADAARKEPGDAMDNATLGYIHENGAPEANIPARPFLMPGIKAAQPKIVEHLKQAALAALKGDGAGVDRSLHRAGLTAQNSAKALINAGIAPELSEATLRARARRGRKGALQELANRKAGKDPSLELAKPLIDTGQLRNAITYVVRKK